MCARIISSLIIVWHLFLCNFIWSKKYDLPDGWSVRTEDLVELQAANRTGSLQLIHSQPGEEIVSGNGTFALAFFRFTNQSDTYLSVVIGANLRKNSSTAASVVWTVNRDTPVRGNATLKLGPMNSILLTDSSDKIVWQSPQNASGIELQESGEFSIYNRNGFASWSSLDHLGDVILEGQKLHQGQEISSSLTSSTMATGNYRLKVEGKGLVFKVTYPDQETDSYFEWNIWNQGNNINNENLSCPFFQTVVLFNRSAINLYYEQTGVPPSPNFTKCGPDLSAPVSGTGESLNYIKLASTGEMTVFSLDSDRLVWEQSPISLMRSRLGDSCFPLTCGPHSICKGNGECQCLINTTTTTSENFQCRDPAEGSKPIPCNALEKRNHHFLNFTGASYLANQFTGADKISTLDDCWNICLSNCSCKAFFYNSGSCYFMTAFRGTWTSNPPSSGFLKLQNGEIVYPKSKTETIAIGTGVGGGTLLVLSLIGLLALQMRRNQARKIAEMLAVALEDSIHHYSYKELKQATSGFSNPIGSGGSGLVFKGTLSDGTRVAVKQLHTSSQREFITEVNTIGSVSHMNIVKLCGFCAEKSHRLLVYEFVANGSLDRWLFQEDVEKKASLDWKTRYNVAVGVARGLSYLHDESQELIMHLDVKPQNILLDEDFTPKISDFGVSKLAEREFCSQGTTTGVRGTPGYLAPEWLLNSVATTKCDVYSYGMVLLELIGGRRNLPSNNTLNLSFNDSEGDETLSCYFPAWAVEKMRQSPDNIRYILDSRISEEVPEADAQLLIFVALWCIQEDPGERPSMECVVQMLEGAKQVPEPPLAFHFAIPSPGIISIST